MDFFFEWGVNNLIEHDSLTMVPTACILYQVYTALSNLYDEDILINKRSETLSLSLYFYLLPFTTPPLPVLSNI